MGCSDAVCASVLQWPSRRSLVVCAMLSYVCWIAVVHHQASKWIRPEMLAIAELLVPLEKIEGTKAAWRSFIVEGVAEGDGKDQSTRPMMLKAKNSTSIRNITQAPTGNLTAAQFVGNSSYSKSMQQFSSDFLNAPQCDPLQPNDITFTLVTQCDDERVEMVAQHCWRWSGPLSVAVYSDRSSEEIYHYLVSLGCAEEQIRVNTLSPSESLDKELYPINHLRNIAIRNTATTHIVYMDIDFLPSGDLESTLSSDSLRDELSKDYKHALVIPAFEYKPRCQNCSSQTELLDRMPRSKDELMRLHDNGEASMFHEYWPVAHDSTDYMMWKHQGHGSLLPIACIKSNHYEPYLIIRRCREMPPFQEAFTGYGYNKASFTMQLQAMQYQLSQVGGIFCTHFPHVASKARQVFDQDKAARAGRRLEIENLVKNFTRWLNSTYGNVLPRVPSCKDLRRTFARPTASEANSGAADGDSTGATQFLADSRALGECYDIQPDEVTYSLVTQCSNDRLWMMEHHCKRWSDNRTWPHISLVVYTNDTLTDVKQKLRDLSCPLDEGMTVQVFGKIYNDEEYPVNHFRNEALAAVNTTHVVYLDVDFWPSTNLFSTLNAAPIRTKLSQSVKHSLVVPAFQLLSQCKTSPEDCPEQHIPLMPYEKDEQMLALLSNGNITAFNVIHNRDGHGSTRYDLWMDQAADRPVEIGCVRSNRYEPYLVVRACRDLPPFQPVFTGYGKNKISWILHLRRLGWRFFQTGEAFVVHYPHMDSKAKRAWKGGSIGALKRSVNTTSFMDSMRSQNDRHFVAFRQWLGRSVPNRTRVFKCLRDVSQDDDAQLWISRDDPKPVE